jgi:Clr5 domain
MSSQNLPESETRSGQGFRKPEQPASIQLNRPPKRRPERIPAWKWEELKPEIRRLYMEEGLPIDSVIKTLQESYGIIAR